MRFAAFAHCSVCFGCRYTIANALDPNFELKDAKLQVLCIHPIARQLGEFDRELLCSVLAELDLPKQLVALLFLDSPHFASSLPEFPGRWRGFAVQRFRVSPADGGAD